MQAIRLYRLDDTPCTPQAASVSVTSVFPHIAVVEVCMRLPPPTQAAPSPLVLQGQPNIPSLRVLVDGSPFTDYEIIARDITNARMLVHAPPSADVLTLQWHTSFVPIDETRMALKLPTVLPTVASEQRYLLAVDWGTIKTSTTVVDGKGEGVIDKQLGVFETHFTFNAAERNSLAVFVYTGRSATGKTSPVRHLVTSVARASGIWIVSVLLALVATFIYGRL